MKDYKIFQLRCRQDKIPQNRIYSDTNPSYTNGFFQITNQVVILAIKGFNCIPTMHIYGAQWLSGRVLDSRPKGRGFEPHRRHCVVSLSKNINPSLVLVQPRKTRPFITERLLMGRKESNQTNKQNKADAHLTLFPLGTTFVVCSHVRL